MELDADAFQKLLDESRMKRLPKSNEELIEEVEKVMDTQEDVPDQSEELKELEKILEPPAELIPAELTPVEIVNSVIATIENCALTMADEGRRAAGAVSAISQLIKKDSEEFASEALKLNSKFCSRIADYLKECQDVHSNFKQQKEAMIKRVQMLGPLIKTEREED
jgi:hypothetical protein